MPLYIPQRHLDRIFPFEFYNEFTEAQSEYIPLSFAFLAKAGGSNANLKDLYIKDQDMMKTHNHQLVKNNIIKTDFLTDLLLLKPLVSKSNIINGQVSTENTLNLGLVVQYFDIHQQPIFTQEMPIEAIRQIPELLWDDPNMFLGVLNFETKEIAYLKGPDFLEEKYLD